MKTNGKVKYQNGEYYIGQFLKGKKHGKGKVFYDDDKIKYDGDFFNDEKEGFGKYYYNNGEYYIGQFINNKRHGKGKEYYKNGKIKYDGDFVNDK